MEKYLNVCTECKQKFVTEDDRQAFFDKVCLLCGSEGSIVSASKDMIFTTYVRRLILRFGSVVKRDEALRELENDLDMFKTFSDIWRPTAQGIYNKRAIVKDLARVFDGTLYKRVNVNTFVEERLRALVFLLDIDIEKQKKDKQKSILKRKTI